MTMTRLQDRFDLAKQVPAPDLADELDQRLREVSPLPIDGRPHIAQRVLVGAGALIIFIVAGAFAWSAFRPSGESATVGSNDSTALVASLVAPADGTIPGLTLTYGSEDRQYFAEGGHWPGVNGFNQPGFVFATPLPPGTPLTIGGDDSQVSGKLEVLEKNYQSTGQELPLDLSGGSATLPNDPGFYRLDLTGTWPHGTAEFFVVIHIAAPSEQGTSLGSQHLPGRATKEAIASLNSMACNVGRLDNITVSGRTDVAHLATELPIMAGTTGSASWQNLPGDTPVYAAVVRGHCESGGQSYVQGYVLFDDQGLSWFQRVWNAGLEPHLSSPFGPAANAGLGI
jgi:hypothetical protein